MLLFPCLENTNDNDRIYNVLGDETVMEHIWYVMMLIDVHVKVPVNALKHTSFLRRLYFSMP